ETERIDRLHLLPASQRQLVLRSGQADEALAWSPAQCVHEWFEAQARGRADATAVISAGVSLSYGELNARANRLAHALRHAGVVPEARVALCLERGADFVVALLAVLKAGGAYVPLDPGVPGERLRWLLGDCAPVVVVTQGPPPAT